MKRIALVFLCLLMLATPAFADKIAMPRSYKLPVGQNIFVMLAPYDQPLQAAPGQNYSASGLYRADGSMQPLWTVDWFAWDSEVKITNDGEYLTRIGPWPTSDKYDELAIAFYRSGRLTRSYAVSDLVRHPERLPHSASHYQWRESADWDEAKGSMTVKTTPGAEFVFDIRTGEMLSGDTGTGPVQPAGGSSGGLIFWLIGAGGSLFYLLAKLFRGW